MESINFRSLKLEICSKGDVWNAISGDSPVRIATANPEIIEEACGNPKFKKALEGMSHVTIDGIGLFFALKLTTTSPLERYQGVQLLLDALNGQLKGVARIALLGGSPGSVEVVQKMFSSIVVFAEEGGYFDRENPELSEELTKKLLDSKPDFLAIGLGAPKQELLIRHLSKLDIHTMVGVGGSFEFIAGKKPRAPKLFHTLGLEWLWRASTENGHIFRLWRAVIIFPIRSAIWLLTHSRKAK